MNAAAQEAGNVGTRGNGWHHFGVICTLHMHGQIVLIETDDFLRAHRHVPNNGVCVIHSFWNLENFCSTFDHPDITVLVDWA